MNNQFSLGTWVSQSVSLGAKKETAQIHMMYRAVFFEAKEDRDAFLDLSVEVYPFETFTFDTLNGAHIIQHKFIKQ